MDGESLVDSHVCDCDSLGHDFAAFGPGRFPGGPVPRLCGFGCLSAICAPFFFFFPSPFALSPSRGEPDGRGDGGGASPPLPPSSSAGGSSTMAGVPPLVSCVGSVGSGVGAEMRWQKLRMK